MWRCDYERPDWRISISSNILEMEWPPPFTVWIHLGHGIGQMRLVIEQQQLKHKFFNLCEISFGNACETRGRFLLSDFSVVSSSPLFAINLRNYGFYNICCVLRISNWSLRWAASDGYRQPVKEVLGFDSMRMIFDLGGLAWGMWSDEMEAEFGDQVAQVEIENIPSFPWILPSLPLPR